MIFIRAVATLAVFGSLSSAHMIMEHPIPMGHPDSSPLNADGSNFPCKVKTDADWSEDAGVNNFVAGQSYPLSFIGSAVHGGGSCQVSLTEDQKPTASSKWMVIKSIEGGCPATLDGNFAADPTAHDAATFQYTIPADMPAKNYTIAWTWHNRIGNREMYMNCGRAIVSGASKKRYAPTPKTSVLKRDNFPGLYIANIHANGVFCSTTEGVDVQYPQPGADLTVGPAAKLSVMCADSQLADAAGSGSSGGSSPSVGSSSAAGTVPSATSAAAAAGGAATVTVQPIPGGNSSPTGGFAGQPTVSPGSFATASAGSGSPVASSSSIAAAVPSTPPTSSGSPSTGSSTGAQSGPCTQEGAWACSASGTSFQRCASGLWSVTMSMAAGTTCTPGISSTFAMNAAGSGGAKRDLKSHLARRRHAQVVS